MRLLLLLLLLIVVAAAIFAFVVRRVTVMEYQQGVRYRRGRFLRVLAPGEYWLRPYHDHVSLVDTRLRLLPVQGQDLLTSDGVSIKLSIALQFKVVDAAAALNKVEKFQETLYLQAQLAVRERVASLTIDELLEERARL